MESFSDEDLIKTNTVQVSSIPYISDLIKGRKVNLPKVPGKLVVQLSTAPISSILRRGPEGRNPVCICPYDCKHISFFEAMKMDDFLTEVGDFCPDRNSFLTGNLPCWLTGLKNKTEFVRLPTVYHLFHTFSKGTFWWKNFNGDNGESLKLSREARLLLLAATGKPLLSVGYMTTRELLGCRTDPAAMHRIRNWLITLDGLQISLLLGSQGHAEICNWIFFDRVTQTYLKSALMDLFKTTDVDTYYSNLKKYRGLLKDKVLKEQSRLEMRSDGSYFPGGFFFFDKFVKVLDLNVSILTPAKLKTVAYLIQTRAAGLPPKPVVVRAVNKFLDTVSQTPQVISREQAYEISHAIDSVCKEIKNQKNFENLMNRANLTTKISLSNSASFFCPREAGGKVEDARILLSRLPNYVPIFDLDSGQILRFVYRYDSGLNPGELLLHHSIFVALTDLVFHDPGTPHIGDVRISTVLEPGKARVITVSRVEHSVILHPLAHLLSALISTIPSSKTGMTASNHMWDTYKRINKEHISRDGYLTGISSFLCSEDWESATDSLNPYAVGLFFDGYRECLQLPRFYTNLCKRLLIMPRRVYDESILKTQDYSKTLTVKYLGIFQGDPCCKQMLHTCHLVSRKIGINRLLRLGLKSITPPIKISQFSKEKLGCVPNVRLQIKRMTKEDLETELITFVRRNVEVDLGHIRRGFLLSIGAMAPKAE